MAKIYVTGCAGMIGSNAADILLQNKGQVIGIDNFWRGRKENIKKLETFPGFEFRYCDISADSSWADDMDKSDTIIHIADIVAGIGYVFDNEWGVFSQNNRINTAVASIVVDKFPRKLIYLGTACSYPLSLQRNIESSELSESLKFPAEPESGYGWSKLLGEIEFKLAVKKSNTQFLTLDLHNVYGAPCVYADRTSQVIPSLIWRALSNPNQPLTVWGDGSQGRAFVHVDDVTSAIKSAITYEGTEDCIMIGPDICTSIREVAEIICQHPKIKIDQIEYDITKPTGDIGRFADYSLANSVLAWAPSVPINTGIFELIDYIVDQEKM